MSALEYLDDMNESGRIQYDDYVNLHNAVSLEAVKAETTEETRVWYSFGVNSGKAVGFSAEHIVERLERETMGPVQVDKVERRTVTTSEWLPVETEGGA